MSYPLVRDLAADGVPVVVTCRVMGFTPQAFYKWRANPVSTRDWSDAHLVDAAREIHADDPVFGYRFIADELEAERGIRASENRVHRLCRQHGISSVLARRWGRSLKPGPPVHDDLVRREFGAERPNVLWLTDITEHRTDEGKLYISQHASSFLAPGEDISTSGEAAEARSRPDGPVLEGRHPCGDQASKTSAGGSSLISVLEGQGSRAFPRSGLVRRGG